MSQAQALLQKAISAERLRRIDASDDSTDLERINQDRSEASFESISLSREYSEHIAGYAEDF
jgi:hypothetical protein